MLSVFVVLFACMLVGQDRYFPLIHYPSSPPISGCETFPFAALTSMWVIPVHELTGRKVCLLQGTAGLFWTALS